MARTPDASVTKAIHEAALTLVTANGLSGLSMEKVAAEAGVNKTTLYRRYKNVESLLTEVVSAITAESVPTPNKGSLREDLIQLSNAASKVLDEPTNRTLMAILVTTSEPASVRRQWWQGRVDAVATIYEQAMQRSEPLPDIDPEQLLERLSGYLHIRTTILRRPPDKREVAAVIDELIGSREN